VTHGRWLLGPVVAFVVIVGGATASGYWSSAGGGSGSARTGTSASVTLGPGTPSRDLFPGGTGDVAVSVTNSNSFAVHIGTLELGTGGYSVDPGHPGCPPEVLTFTAQNNGGSGWTVPAGTFGASLHLSNAVTMSIGAPTACQGTVFGVHLVGTS